MQAPRVGSKPWLWRERQAILNAIDWQQSMISNLELLPKNRYVNEIIELEKEQLKRLLADLKLLRKDWRGYAERYKKEF